VGIIINVFVQYSVSEGRKMNDLQVLVEELVSVGLTVGGVDSEGRVDCEGVYDPVLPSLVVNAHDHLLTSEECWLLRDYLGEESQEWVAYLEARKGPVREARAQRYRVETDPLGWKARELEVSGEDATSAWEEWKAIKDSIREELPYPE
jgi:hypothetical protein